MASRSLVVKLRAEIGSYKSDMDSAAKSTKGVGDAAEAGSKKATQANAAMGKSAKDAGAAVKAAGDDAGKAKGGISSLSEAIRDNRGAWDDLSNKAAIGGLAIAAGIGMAVKRFADFDAAMSAVQANSGSTGAELESLRQAALDLGADSQFSAKEAAEGINELSKAGVSAGDILGGGLKGSLDLAAAGQIGVGEAAETAATAMTQFNLEGGEIPHVADLLTNAANKAQGGVGDLAQALKQGGLVAASTGLSIDETTASLAAFASAGLVGSDAGTSLKTMLQRLSAPSGKAAQEMERLGISAYDAQGEFVGMEALAGQLKTGLEDLTPAQRNQALATIFGSDAVRAANILYSEGAEGISKWTDEVTESGAAAKQAAILNDNLKGDVERLGGALDSVFIKTGGSANGVLRTLTQALTGIVDHVGGIPGPILLVGGALASTALMAPKAITAFQDYRTNLDDLGLSMDKIREKSPRAASALGVLGKVAIGLAVFEGVRIVMDGLQSALDEAVPPAYELAAALEDLHRSGDMSDINKGIQSLDVKRSSAAAVSIKDMGEAVEFLSNQSSTDKTRDWVQGLVGMDSDVDRLTEYVSGLDQALANMYEQDPAKAKETWATLVSETEKAGGSIDELRKQYPLAAAAAKDAASGGKPYEDHLAKVEEEAEAAKMAIDDLKTALEVMGGGFRAEQAASRDVTNSLKEMRDVVKEGKGGWSELSASMEESAGKALTFAGAQAEMGRGSETIAQGIQRVRDQVIKSGTDAGYSKAFMEDYADSIGLIPKEATTLVEAAGVTESTANIMAMDDSIMLLNGKTVTVEEAGALASQGRVKGLKTEIKDAKGKTVTVTEIGSTAAGERVVLLNGKVQVLKGKSITMTADTSPATTALSNLQGMINRMTGKSIYMDTTHRTFYETHGMRVAGVTGQGGIPQETGGIRSRGATLMADGGMIGPGMMRPGLYKTSKAGILMAEDPAADFELYASANPKYKDRSKAILKYGVEYFGGQVQWPTPMARGGIRDYYTLGEISEDLWYRLRDQGWKGRAGDNVERIYRPKAKPKPRPKPAPKRVVPRAAPSKHAARTYVAPQARAQAASEGSSSSARTLLRFHPDDRALLARIASRSVRLDVDGRTLGMTLQRNAIDRKGRGF